MKRPKQEPESVVERPGNRARRRNWHICAAALGGGIRNGRRGWELGVHWKKSKVKSRESKVKSEPTGNTRGELHGSSHCKGNPPIIQTAIVALKPEFETWSCSDTRTDRNRLERTQEQVKRQNANRKRQKYVMSFPAERGISL